MKRKNTSSFKLTLSGVLLNARRMCWLICDFILGTCASQSGQIVIRLPSDAASKLHASTEMTAGVPKMDGQSNVNTYIKKCTIKELVRECFGI